MKRINENFHTEKKRKDDRLKSKSKHLLILLIMAALLTTLAGCQKPFLERPSPVPDTNIEQTTLPTVPIETPPEMSVHEPKTSVTPESFECDIVERVMRELTKPEYGGRLAGTEGARLAALFLTATYKDIGLEIWDGGSYILPFPLNSRLGDTGYNVAGVIPGKDRTKAIVITAHFDGIFGENYTFTEGALDNASGVAAMLRVAANLLHSEKQPETDILFVAFDGEELMLQGSRDFIFKAVERYETLYNINIDSIGLNDAVYQFNIAGQENERDRALRLDLAEIFDRRGIQYIDIPFEMPSDNMSFTALGVPTAPLTLEVEKITLIFHSERDILEVVDIALIEELADTITEFVIQGQGKMY